MRGVIVIVAIICLLAPGCTIGHNEYTPSRWDYMSPEHVRCSDNETKLCRQYGAELLCECVA